MIFVTIGTQQQNFNRLFDYINALKTKEEIVFQKGKSTYKLNSNIKAFEYLSYDEMDYYFNNARVIIAHGGGGTIFKALKLHKKVIVVPRLSKFKEHINDHQLEFSLYLKNMNYCLVALNQKEFNKALRNIDKTTFKEYVSPEKQFVKNIKKEIDRLLDEK